MASFGFGTTANTQSSAGTLFGAPATSNTTGFGTTTNNNAAGTLFGANTSNSSAAGTLFGGSATTAAPAATGFGGFGATSAAPAASGFGGFGATSQPAANTAGTTGFGGFGATSQPAANTAGTTGFGGFGATSQPAANTAGTTGFGGFGTTPAASTAGTTGFGGFGTTPVTSTAGTAGFGGFGTTPATNTTGTTGFGGFGTTPATNTTGTTGFGGFGTTPATSTAGTTGFGGFGTTATSTAGTTGFGGFGGFGAGNSNTTSLFGAKPQTGFGTQPTTQPATGFGVQQPQQPAPVQEKVWQNLALIRAHFDPTSPLCQFRHYFYNMVPPNEVHLYVRPPNQDEQLWNEAVRKNPNPTNLVPVLAVGFDDILKRMETQSKQVALHENKLKETEERLKAAQRKYNLDTLVKLEGHKRRHIYLTQRLLELLRRGQVLKFKGSPLSAAEEQFMVKLRQLASDSNNPDNLKSKMISLWNQIDCIKERRYHEGHSKVETWSAVNEEDTRVIAKVLSDYQQGIKHMTATLEEDTKQLESIESGLRSKRKSSANHISYQY